MTSEGLLPCFKSLDKSRNATGIHIDALEDGCIDHELFSLSSIKGKKDLVAVDSTEYDDGNSDLRGSEDEENQEKTEDESSSDIDSGEERRRYDEQIEEIPDHVYEQYVAKKDGSTKQRKHAKQAFSDQLEGGDGDDGVILSDHDPDKDEADPEASPLMVPLDNGEGPTQEEITNRWFDQDIFAEAVEQGDLGSMTDDEMKVDNQEERPAVPEKAKVKKRHDERPSIPDKAKEKKINNAAGPNLTQLQASKAEERPAVRRPK